MSAESVVSDPPPHRTVAIGVPNLGAGVVIEVPSSLICDHLVVVIIEHGCASGHPGVVEQGSHPIVFTQCVGPHNGHCFLSTV